ncbi:MAG: hypothetical protein HYS07_02440 [Chlamydiae bacterium]|nr:hypothetical protein [Chlamydiota bacterium]MBI3276692.1 hypothetical protein [Chlamydiota bacterium]
MFGKIPLLLIVMGMGYFVALKATEEVGFLKTLGNVIAGILIVGSLLGLGLSGYVCYKGCTLGQSWKCPVQRVMTEQ